MKRKWDIQGCTNFWFSLGFHFDHKDPSITLHLPCVILSFGHLKQPGFRGCKHGFGFRKVEIERWQECLARGAGIAAIREYRLTYGVSLKDAKEVIDKARLQMKDKK